VWEGVDGVDGVAVAEVAGGWDGLAESAAYPPLPEPQPDSTKASAKPPAISEATLARTDDTSLDFAPEGTHPDADPAQPTSWAAGRYPLSQPDGTAVPIGNSARR